MGRTFKDLRRHGREPRARVRATRCAATRKVCFPSAEAAHARAAELLENDRRSPENRAAGFRAYRCPRCNQWHLTSQL